MSKPFADSAAHNKIPDGAALCILARRHLGFPALHDQARQLVRIRFGSRRNDYTDFIDYTATCDYCETVRTMRRDRYSNHFVWATYVPGEGYAPPDGYVWDREHLYEIYSKRHPVEGEPIVIDQRV